MLVQEDASNWNGLLLNARGERGPQWDVTSQMYVNRCENALIDNLLSKGITSKLVLRNISILLSYKMNLYQFQKMNPKLKKTWRLKPKLPYHQALQPSRM